MLLLEMRCKNTFSQVQFNLSYGESIKNSNRWGGESESIKSELMLEILVLKERYIDDLGKIAQDNISKYADDWKCWCLRMEDCNKLQGDLGRLNGQIKWQTIEMRGN